MDRSIDSLGQWNSNWHTTCMAQGREQPDGCAALLHVAPAGRRRTDMQRNIPLQQVASPTMRRFMSSDDLLGEIQATLSALADLECRYQIEEEQLKQSSKTASAMRHLCSERESRRHQEREPYLHRLNELERCIQTLISCD
jgi:hypothetical protein